jgi:hypothetical protein
MIDERFWSHRSRALSTAALAGAGVAGFWLLRGLLRGEGLRPDLLSILLAMLVTKFAAMTWFHFRG